MNTKLKKALYESIMRNVAKQVKKALNENIVASSGRDVVTDFDEVIVPVLKARLSKRIVEFEFKKADGSFRSAKGTTNKDIIDEVSPNTLDGEDNRIKAARFCPGDVVKFFDVEKLAWRSCKVGRLIRILDNNVDINDVNPSLMDE